MKLNRFLPSVLAAAIASSTLISSAQAYEPKVINFGIISTDSSQALKSVWEPFLQDMSKKLGVPVKGFYATDYAGIIQGMKFGKVDIAWYGNKSAIEAVDHAGGEIFAQTVDAEGNPGYWSLLLAHSDSPLNSVEDILDANKAKNLSFGNGDPNSTSGNLVPGYYIFAQNNIDPKKHYKRMVVANHETNALAVANKQVDFATNNTENLRRIELNFPEKFKQLKVIWKSPLIPADPLVWRKDLDQDAKARIKAFILSYGRYGQDMANEKAILKNLQWAPFYDSNNDQLLPIRQLALVKDKIKIEADKKYTAAEKQAKIAAIDAELNKLQARLDEISK